MKDKKQLKTLYIKKNRRCVGNSKKSRKRIEKALMDGVKIYQPKKKRKAAANNSGPALSRTNSLSNTKQITVAKETFDDDQTLSTSWIYITETNMK